MSERAESPQLPAGVRVLERGWLSANGILFESEHGTALVDSGYGAHAQQTVALVRGALGSSPLDLLLNTHLHSDHCGGNAALQAAFPQVKTFIPPGLAKFVADWDAVALTYTPTGQVCPPFHFDGLLVPGQEVALGAASWQIHGAPGHDPHSVVLFEPSTRALISADALWENGFGIVFEELEGVAAFDEVAATFDLIESLAPRLVIPGHGAVFTSVDGALARARSRLKGFVANPDKHARHAAKVLLKFKLLELQQVDTAGFLRWAVDTPYLGLVHSRFAADTALPDWVRGLIQELVLAGVARIEADMILNS